VIYRCYVTVTFAPTLTLHAVVSIVAVTRTHRDFVCYVLRLRTVCALFSYFWFATPYVYRLHLRLRLYTVCLLPFTFRFSDPRLLPRDSARLRSVVLTCRAFDLPFTLRLPCGYRLRFFTVYVYHTRYVSAGYVGLVVVVTRARLIRYYTALYVAVYGYRGCCTVAPLLLPFTRLRDACRLRLHVYRVHVATVTVPRLLLPFTSLPAVDVVTFVTRTFTRVYALVFTVLRLPPDGSVWFTHTVCTAVVLPVVTAVTRLLPRYRGLHAFRFHRYLLVTFTHGCYVYAFATVAVGLRFVTRPFYTTFTLLPIHNTCRFLRLRLVLCRCTFSFWLPVTCGYVDVPVTHYTLLLFTYTRLPCYVTFCTGLYAGLRWLR